MTMDSVSGASESAAATMLERDSVGCRREMELQHRLVQGAY